MRWWLPAFLSMLLVPWTFAQPANLGEVDAAINYSALQPGAQAAIAVRLTVAPHHHAQSNKPKGEGLIATEIKMEPTPGIVYLDPVYPAGKDIVDPLLGPLNVYEDTVTIYVPFTVDASAPAAPAMLKGEITYQICNEEGTCFAPETAPVVVETKIVAPTQPVEAVNAARFKDFDARVFATSQPAATQNATPAPPTTQSSGQSQEPPFIMLGGRKIVLSGLVVVLPLALLVGLIFNVMPCVLPVLPLKALGFYEASQHHRARTLAFGLMFSLGLIAIFAGLGLFVVLSKSIIGRTFQWGEWFSIGWVVWTMGLVLVLLGIAMLGAFNVNLPSSVYGLSFKHDTMGGNFMWGALTAILSTPCTAPLFPAILGWALLQPVVVGMIGIISIGVGMALPYLVLSAFPELARHFPRTGPASELVKQSMAFLMFGTAAWLVGPRIVGNPEHFWLVVAVAGWAGLFLLLRGAQIFKTSNAMLVLSAVVLLICGGSVLLALEMTGKLDEQTSASNGGKKLWKDYSEEAFAAARASGNPVLVKFTAAWCANCQYVERTVFTDGKALEALREQNVILLKADLTYSDAPGWKLLNELGQTGIPFTAIYPAKSEKPLTLASIYTSDGLIDTLHQMQ